MRTQTAKNILMMIVVCVMFAIIFAVGINSDQPVNPAIEAINGDWYE